MSTGILKMMQERELHRDPLRLRSRVPGGFQTVRLNIVGWSALIGVGIVVGALLALVSPLQLWVALTVGVAGTWGTLLVLDRRRHLNSSIRLGDGRLDAETGALIVQELEGLGITASYQEISDEDEDGPYVDRAISCLQRHADEVRRIMNTHLYPE